MTPAFIHDELVRRAVRWLRKPCSGPRPKAGDRWHKPGCGVVVPELVSWSGEIPDAIGWIASGYSYAIECKTSLADFRADGDKPRFRIGAPCVGAECLYLVPAGVVRASRLPPGWGLLYAHARGITVEVPPAANPSRDVRGEMSLMYSLLRRVEIRGHLTECLSPKWGGQSDPRGKTVARVA